MIKRSIPNFLAVTVMVFMTVFIALFLYSNIHLKNKITLQTVQEMEFISDVFAKAILDVMSGGHDKETYAVITGYGNLMGVEDLGIYKLTGEEAFQAPSLQPEGGSKMIRKIGPADENFWKVSETMNLTDFFDHDKRAYTRYLPLRSEEACINCHIKNTPLGILKVSFSAKSHFETLAHIQQFIWALGLIVALPIAGLFISGVIIRDKNRLYAQLEEANNDLRATYNNLSETKYYLQMILDNSKALVITTDTEGKIVEFNREAEALLEYKKDEAAGKDVLMLYENPEQRNELISRSRFEDGEIWAARNREVTLRSKSGKLFYINLTLSALVDDKGGVMGTVGIGKDISEQKMLQFKLIQSEKLAGIGTLASGIAHEINNPLAGILGMAEAIRDEDDANVIKSYANDIIHYATDAGKIVKELSAYSRSAHNEAQSTVDLSVVVEDSLKLVRHAAPLTSIEVVHNLEKDSLIFANASELQQVFVNLIINAIHAMNDGGRLIINCFREGKFVKATVSDTGHGIPIEHISRIYDPFFTTKPPGKGTGLGLYIVYRIVTKYGGSIDAESAEGNGTTFTLKFPAVDDV